MLTKIIHYILMMMMMTTSYLLYYYCVIYLMLLYIYCRVTSTLCVCSQTQRRSAPALMTPPAASLTLEPVLRYVTLRR
jgi:hypothetical protein